MKTCFLSVTSLRVLLCSVGNYVYKLGCSKCSVYSFKLSFDVLLMVLPFRVITFYPYPGINFSPWQPWSFDL